jgi:hypothetical protein
MGNTEEETTDTIVIGLDDVVASGPLVDGYTVLENGIVFKLSDIINRPKTREDPENDTN